MNKVILAFYEQTDWVRFIAMIDDPENMHDTWAEWYNALLDTEKQLKKQGFKTLRFPVNIYELAEHCRQKGIKNDGKARSAYVSELASRVG